eukprot:Rhum_TRINITY_DN12470_c1_g1::Rhum_TRINITY_DN12470_c1_g1_i1::g.52132::m.52132
MGGTHGKERGRNGARAQGKSTPVVSTKVSLAHMGLRTLPEHSTATASRIELLDVSHNKLTDCFLRPGCLGQFTALTTLVADDNRLSSFISFPEMPHLRFLSLNCNNVQDSDLVSTLLSQKCPNLRTLSLVDNPCWPSYEHQAKAPAALQVYRAAVLRNLPALKVLDCMDVTQKDREAASQLSLDIEEGRTDIATVLQFEPPPPPSTARKERATDKSVRRDAAKEEKRDRRKKEKKEKAKDRKARRRNQRGGGASAAAGDGAAPGFPPPPPRVCDSAAADLEGWASSSSESCSSDSSNDQLDSVLKESMAKNMQQRAVPPPPPPTPPPPPPPPAATSSTVALAVAAAPPPPPPPQASVAAAASASAAPLVTAAPPMPAADQPPRNAPRSRLPASALHHDPAWSSDDSSF